MHQESVTFSDLEYLIVFRHRIRGVIKIASTRLNDSRSIVKEDVATYSLPNPNVRQRRIFVPILVSYRLGRRVTSLRPANLLPDSLTEVNTKTSTQCFMLLI